MFEENDDEELKEFLGIAAKPSVSFAPSSPKQQASDEDIESYSLGDFLDTQQIAKDKGLSKPWMRFHKFNLVKTVEEVTQIVDAAIAHGRCALDLETGGFDNRINFDENGVPETVHKIVGFCLSVKAVGYYIPVRHKFDPRMGERDPNVPIEGVEREITRLCKAAQPVPSEPEFKDCPYLSNVFETPPRVVIYFWHGKFDQEFLFPVTGIELWHPASWEDGMLAAYSVYSDDIIGLKDKAFKNLAIWDPDVEGDAGKYPYEMIEFTELFPKGTKNRRFYDLYPEDGSAVTLYGCSDAICTELLCETARVKWEHTQEGLKYEYKQVVEKAVKQHDFVYKLEKRTAQAVRDMERPRVKVDKERIQENLKQAEEELAQYNTLIVDLAKKSGFTDFNPGSPQQLSNFLFEKKGLDINPKPEKNANGFYKTDAATLELASQEENAPKVLGWIVKYRQIEKIIGTYLKSMANNCDEHDQLRFSFNQTGAATGRFTAPAGRPEDGFGGIPIHGIPARDDPNKPASAQALRKVFVAREGYTLVKVDYAGQELRIVSNISGEPKWVNEFVTARQEGREADLHTLTAKAFFGDHITKNDKKERNAGKIANFSLIYGGGTQAIMRATKCDKVEGARRKANFDKSVPVFAQWVKSQHTKVKKQLGVYTAFKRFIYIPDANIKGGDTDSNGRVVLEEDARKIRASCERQSTNYPIQGCLRLTSMVLTIKGQQEIGELQGSEFEVWTGTRWASATAHDMGACELANLQLKDGTLIECDTRHKLLVIDDEGQRWIEFKDLHPGMAVARSLCEPVEFLPNPLPLIEQRVHTASEVPTLAPSKHEEFWYWMGRYMGDGWLDSKRGGLFYSFGSHENDAVERCLAFWRECGLNPHRHTAIHTPKFKESTRYTVDVWSVSLCDWMLKLGFRGGVTAHTKRCPSRIFGETLANRKAFLKGMMDSDGHKPKLPQKIDGVWESTKKGNPYTVHLCQRPLLVDLKRLFRTVGVESVIRGPYRSGVDKDGEPTTSYRLDIQRRMYDRNVLGLATRLPKFKDMNAPQFLVNEFLAKGPYDREAFPNESAYVLYLRLKEGGKIGVYTLKYLCDSLGVKLRSPIYAYQRLVSKEALGREEHTYTLSVQDPLHRFESDGVITKNSGADIMKLSLVLLLKEFILRGWRRIGGDDSVRVLMTVHDELVFEVKHERLMEVVPKIIEIMESPYKLAGWKIPLVVEPLISLTWDAKHDWYEILHGKAPVPEWLQGILVPGVPHVETKVAEKPKVAAPTLPPPRALPEARGEESAPETPRKPVVSQTGYIRVATFAIGREALMDRYVARIFEAVSGSVDPEKQIYLRLMTTDGSPLLDISDRFFVVPSILQSKLEDRLMGQIWHEVKDEPV